MRIEYLPPTELIGYAVEPGDLVQTVAKALAHRKIAGVRYVLPVHGTPSSMRILSAAPIGAGVPLPKELGAQELVQELLNLTRREARYPKQVLPATRQGWEFRVGYIGNVPVIVAAAAWI